MREQSKGATVRGLAKEMKDGQTFYEVSLNVSGHNKDVLMDPGGRVVEVEEQVPLNSLPEAAKAEITRRAGKGRILMVESITKDDALVGYEAHVRTGRRITEIKVTPDGKPIAP